MTDAMLQDLASRVKDPAIKHFMSTFKVAQESGAPKAVLDSLEKGLEQCLLRLRFEEAHTTPESDTCQRIKMETFHNDWKKVHEEGKTKWHIQCEQMSNRTENQFLKSMVSVIKPKQVLEIGMYTGFTGTAMAEALPEGSQITTVDQDEYLREFATNLTQGSPHKHKMNILIGSAIPLMKEMIQQGKKFDLVFLDSDDAEFDDYVKLCFEKNLLAPEGTVLVDNAFMYGDSYNDSSCDGAKFAASIISNPKLHVVLVPVKDGIFMIRRRAEVDGGKC